MSYYAKTAVFLTLFFLYSYLAKELIWSNSRAQEEKALQLYRNSNYKLALAHLEKLEKESNSSKPIFYQAYILREEEKLEQSTLFFKKALNNEKDKKSPQELFEINLNLALNSYMMKNQELFKDSMKSLVKLKKSFEEKGLYLKRELVYLEFFRGIEAFLEEDYERALLSFKTVNQEAKLLKSGLSPWMTHSINHSCQKSISFFNPLWISKKIALCYIETSRFESAANLLKILSRQENEEIKNSINFLKIYLKFKQGLLKPAEKISIQQEIQKNELFEEFEPFLNKIETQFLAEIKFLEDPSSFKRKEAFSESLSNKISSNSLFLSLVLEDEKLNQLSLKIFEEILIKIKADQVDSIIFITHQVQNKLQDKLLEHLNRDLESAFKKGEFDKIASYMRIFQRNPKFFTHSLPFLKEKIKPLILKIAQNENSNDQLLAQTLFIYSKIEPNEKERFIFGQELIKEAESLWQQEQKYENALEIYLKSTTLFSSPEQREKFLILVECSFSNLFKNALEGDQMGQHFHILKGIKALNLNCQNKYDESIKKLFLEDAAYFFSRHLYEKALEVASFILLLEPENEQANQIIGLVSYNQGDFKKAFETLKKIKKPDPSILKILKLEKLNTLTP